jgi:hypothetical protein
VVTPILVPLAAASPAAMGAGAAAFRRLPEPCVAVDPSSLPPTVTPYECVSRGRIFVTGPSVMENA